VKSFKSFELSKESFVRVSSERLWVSIVNSKPFRQLATSSLGAPLFDSRVAHHISMARRFVTTFYATRQKPDLFRELKTFCLFIGHTKSGSSMLGSMLDAHPHVILADGSDALQYVHAGFRKEQLFHILLKCSRREAMKGRVTARRLTPYSFEVPDQWQGRYEKLKVIGDTTSETAIRHLAREPRLLDDFQRMMAGVDLKYVHVIRNPFDPISVMMIRGKRSIDNAIERYFNTCEMLAQTRKRLTSSNLLALRYEDVVNQPKASLETLCRYLGAETDDAYLSACTAILHKSPDRTREKVAWDSNSIALVEKKIKEFDFLEGYDFAH
jgi:hypothetical protein